VNSYTLIRSVPTRHRTPLVGCRSDPFLAFSFVFLFLFLLFSFLFVFLIFFLVFLFKFKNVQTSKILKFGNCSNKKCSNLLFVRSKKCSNFKIVHFLKLFIFKMFKKKLFKFENVQISELYSFELLLNFKKILILICSNFKNDHF
jgi:hypothetical protein